MEDFPRQEKVSAQDSHKELENSSYSEHQLFNLRNLHINNKIVDIEGENSEDAANVAASVSQILLEDDEIDSIISKPIHLTRSMESKVNIQFRAILFAMFQVRLKVISTCSSSYLEECPHSLHYLFLILWAPLQHPQYGLLNLQTCKIPQRSLKGTHLSL